MNLRCRGKLYAASDRIIEFLFSSSIMLLIIINALSYCFHPNYLNY